MTTEARSLTLLLLAAIISSATCKIHVAPETTSKTPSLKQLYKLDAALNKFVVDQHNYYRSMVEPPAVHMERLNHSEVLADLAGSYGSRCLYKHSYEKDRTPEYDDPGENLYATNEINTNLTRVVEEGMSLWWEEKKNFHYELANVTAHQCDAGKKCGHYTEIAWETNKAIGCAVVHCNNLFMEGKTYELGVMLVCNYGGGGNYEDERPYKSGKSCSECPDTCLCASDATPPAPVVTPAPASSTPAATTKTTTKATTKATTAAKTKATPAATPTAKTAAKPAATSATTGKPASTKAPKSRDELTTVADKKETTTTAGGAAVASSRNQIYFASMLYVFISVYFHNF